MQRKDGDRGARSIAVRSRGNKRRGLGLLALGLLLVACGGEESSDQPLAPIGQQRSRALPHGDVLGFLSLRAQSQAWSGLQGWLAVGADGLLRSSLFEPGARLLTALMDQQMVGDGALTVLFLDPRVHDSAVAVHVPASRNEVLAALERADCPLTDEGRVRVARRPPASSNPFGTALRLAGMGMPEAEDPLLTGPDAPFADLMWLDYNLVEESGGVLLLPRREGLRNLRDTLEVAHSEAAGAAFLSLDLDRLLDDSRGDFRSALQAPLVGLSLARRGSYDRRTNRKANRWMSGILDLVHDLAAGVDHAFVEEVRAGEWQVYLRTTDDGLTRQLLPAFGDEDPKVLLGDAPLGLAAAGLAYEVDELLSFWEREARSRITRYRVHPEVPAADVERQGRRLWLGVSEPSGPYQLGVGGLAGSRSPLEALEEFSTWVEHSADDGLLSLFLNRRWMRTSAPHEEGALLEWVPLGQSEATVRAGFLADRRFLQYGGTAEGVQAEIERLGRGRPGPWSRLGLLPESCSGILQVGTIGLGARIVLEVDSVGLSLAISIAVGG